MSPVTSSPRSASILAAAVATRASAGAAPGSAVSTARGRRAGGGGRDGGGVGVRDVARDGPGVASGGLAPDRGAVGERRRRSPQGAGRGELGVRGQRANANLTAVDADAAQLRDATDVDHG